MTEITTNKYYLSEKSQDQLQQNLAKDFLKDKSPKLIEKVKTAILDGMQIAYEDGKANRGHISTHGGTSEYNTDSHIVTMPTRSEDHYEDKARELLTIPKLAKRDIEKLCGLLSKQMLSTFFMAAEKFASTSYTAGMIGDDPHH